VTASEPGSTLEFFASADCAVGTGWLSVLIDELQTGVPGGLEVFASVAQLLAPFLQHVFEAEVDDLRMPEEGVLEIPVMFFDSFDAFSARANNAAGTSACSNAVTAP
jgi:hypothetical protein